ncbi:unnamed protein product [Prorocentrum cordatum]|uniref:Uncharacterized protein n=1 Tax=Prorocentrum cordatum TaxID=2364126 RepID=A0ABN9X818_9DINO|nr:unnamed protein product [Polarella glacialis]
MWIQLYRLNKCKDALEDIVPICRRRGGNWHIQGVQALAFTVWKQSKFEQAIELFHEIEELVGSSAALCENIGHSYSSIGNYDEASRYFRKALVCNDEEEKRGKKTGDRAGVLLGLGLIEERLGHLEKALIATREAQQLFRQRADGKPSSLVAKAGMSIAKILMKLSKLEGSEAKRKEMDEEAVEIERENVVLFEVTCGVESPLTASALRGLGEALLRTGGLKEAQETIARSYLLEAQKDAFDLLAVMEVHNLLFSAHMAAMQATGEIDRPAFRGYANLIDTAERRVRAMQQDSNAGAYYKVAGEMKAFAEDYEGAARLLSDAVALFETEEPDKVAGLIQSSLDLKEFCLKQAAVGSATAASGSAAAGAGARTSHGRASASE